MVIPGAAALFTVDEMGQADRLTIAGGLPGITLMETAGRGAARVIQRRLAPVPAVVLCGPGNNGGDGFVIARVLKASGWSVRLGLLGKQGQRRGDAALAAAAWDGPVEPLSVTMLEGAGLVVDALFGAGLARDLEGVALAVVAALRDRQQAGTVTIVAIDVPSGLDGDTGQVRGDVVPADFTVTFHRAKPGHLLMPGRALCGDIRVIDIAIPDAVTKAVAPRQGRNTPSAWVSALPAPGPADHKYRRGHAVLAGGSVMTGAARLAAEAARRIGAGLLTMAVPSVVSGLYRSASSGTLVADCDGLADFQEMIADSRRNAILVGPGHGVGETTRLYAEAALATGRAVVLDADALTVFAGAVPYLAARVTGPLVITPHDGEFARLFPDLTDLGKLARTRIAARRLGGVVVLKGADTVIAEPGGLALINENAPPWLATGGTGDVLAGTVLGLLAQGMGAFDSAAAAVWLNGAAASIVGPDLLAEDLPAYLAAALRQARTGVEP